LPSGDRAAILEFMIEAKKGDRAAILEITIEAKKGDRAAILTNNRKGENDEKQK
jgi:hypothetical protein